MVFACNIRKSPSFQGGVFLDVFDLIGTIDILVFIVYSSRLLSNSLGGRFVIFENLAK